MNQTTGTARNTQATVRAVLGEKHDMPGALLPILHDIQDQLGYVPNDAVADIDEAPKDAVGMTWGAVYCLGPCATILFMSSMVCQALYRHTMPV
jgi:hypothetical protein